MASDLDEIRDRLTWCGNSYLQLASEIDQYNVSAYEVTHNVEEDTGAGIFFIRRNLTVPPDFRIRAGSIIHELRATLDSLACVLALRNGKSDKDTYFPISKSRDVFEMDGLRKKLRNLSESDRQVIAGLSPYQGGNDMLFALHSADLLRKHRRLISTVGGIKDYSVDGGVVTSLETVALAEVTEQYQAFARMGKGTKVHLNILVDISFLEPEAVHGRPVSSVLRDFTRLVQSIIDLFE